MSLSVPFSCFLSETLRIKGKVTVLKKPSILPLHTVMECAWGLMPLCCVPHTISFENVSQNTNANPSAAGVNKSDLYCNDPSVSFFGVLTSTLATVFMGEVDDYKMYYSVVKVNVPHFKLL
jgi:hypothetical protein